MKSTRLFIAGAITLAVAPGSWLAAQVQTNVPEVVSGAKPVAVEQIKIHGTALEGNLEGDAVDRDVIVFLPPSYQKDRKRRYERAIASEKKVAAAKSPADLAAQSPGFASAQYATAAAWAPDPKNPPLYFDLLTKDGVPQPEIVAKYTANSPLAFVDQYIGNLKRYHTISIDVGDHDGLRFDATKLHAILDNYGIANSFEIYSGTHVSAVADRFQNHVLPFFGKNLCFTAGCR